MYINENQQHTCPNLQKRTCLPKYIKLNTFLYIKFISVSLLTALEQSEMTYYLQNAAPV